MRFERANAAVSVAAVIFAAVTSATFAGCASSPKTDSTQVLALAVAPANPTITQGGSLAFTATAFLVDGEAKDVSKDPDTKWSSTNSSIVSIDSFGNADGVSAGQAEIIASRGNLNSPPQLVTVQSGPVPTATPTPAPPATHMLISEVMYDSPGTEPDSEYVELHNPTASAVSLQGWSLGDHGDLMANPHVFGAVTVPAGGYFTICHNPPTATTSCIDVFPTGVFDTSGLFQLVNNGDWLELRDNVNVVVDQMAYGTGYSTTKPPSWCAVNSPAATAKPVSRSPVDSDGDTCDDWVGSAAASPGSATP